MLAVEIACGRRLETPLRLGGRGGTSGGRTATPGSRKGSRSCVREGRGGGEMWGVGARGWKGGRVPLVQWTGELCLFVCSARGGTFERSIVRPEMSKLPVGATVVAYMSTSTMLFTYTCILTDTCVSMITQTGCLESMEKAATFWDAFVLQQRSTYTACMQSLLQRLHRFSCSENVAAWKA